jgi:hypothetical protein
MQYKILETTDGQHRGKMVDIIESEKVISLPDGDSFRFIKLKSLGENIYKVVSFNYVMLIELVVVE